MDLTIAVYRLTATFPTQERYGLTSQMRRAAVSISSNIAEGAGRETRDDFRRFIILARGSNCEIHTQLLVAAELGYCPKLEFQEVERAVVEVAKMLNGLAKYLRVKPSAKQH